MLSYVSLLILFLVMVVISGRDRKMKEMGH